ncbi:hypothetical protein QJS10_CPB12g00142 [Acorus calamus]|uniref:Uncharacterized protein n=1 Tax=Acorus calamus TaxID=4465 RepID=A0AAV9DPF1_ACOCL|nr:hypothetical protein QJS10_CPB12g00142 [Acorus calamus]
MGYGVAHIGTGPDAAYGLAQCFDYLTRTAEDLSDPNIRSLQHRQQMLRAVHVAFLCMQECPNLRPSMSMLLRAEEPLPAPTNMPFTDELTMEFDFEGDSERLLSETLSSAASVATMMYSAFYPR